MALDELKALVARTGQAGKWSDSTFTAANGATLTWGKESSISYEGGDPAAIEQLRAAVDPEVTREAEFYWEWLKHSDNLFGVRSGLFLLGETILLTVAVQVATTIAPWASHFLFAVGTLLSLSWLWYSVAYSCFSRKYISEKAETFERRWAAYQHQKKLWAKISGLLVGFGAPILVLVFWVIACVAYWK